MPAEWEHHQATWLAWPHEQSDWPDVFPYIKNVYSEIVKILSQNEKVEILCNNEALLEEASNLLKGVSNVSFHHVANDRSWMRDSAPTSVINDSNEISWVRWCFNAWARYENFSKDGQVSSSVIEKSKLPFIDALTDAGGLTVLEGGAIDSNGSGSLLVTEQCLLSKEQSRNPSFTKETYEAIFKKYLGINSCIWLGQGVAGDDTHGHIDGVCRFVAPSTVVLCSPRERANEYTEVYKDNVERLKKADINFVDLPLPKKRFHNHQLLPASYANFYVANNVVLVPVFNDANDDIAIGILKEFFPNRDVLGIDSTNLIVGMGALHCITQPQFSSDILK